MDRRKPSPARPRSTLWLWGFWLCGTAALLAFALSLQVPGAPGRVLRATAGALLIGGGSHQGRVVAYQRATRSPYRAFGPDARLTQRQTGWSAIVLGVVLLASAAVLP